MHDVHMGEKRSNGNYLHIHITHKKKKYMYVEMEIIMFAEKFKEKKCHKLFAEGHF